MMLQCMLFKCLFEKFNCLMQPKSSIYVTCTVVDPDLELGVGEGGVEAGFVLLALMAFLPSVIFSLLTQNK